MKTDYALGFYGQEHDGIRPFRWINKHSKINLSGNIPRYIRIPYGLNTQTSQITVKGKYNSYNFRLFEGWHSLQIDLDYIGKEYIELLCPYSFVPLNDSRTLSIQIGELIPVYERLSLNDLEENINSYLENYIKANQIDEEGRQYYLGHIPRYLKTLAYLEEHRFIPGVTLEIGGGGFFTYIAEMRYPNSNFYIDSSDIRKKTNIEDNSLDSIICMEVFEHITDPTGFHEIQFQGVMQFLFECFRILKPGGKMFISTPNAISLLSLYKIYRGMHPNFCAIHYREYSPIELRTIISPLYDIICMETYNVFHNQAALNKDKGYSNLIKCLPCEENNLRGDDIFLICQKKNVDLNMCTAHIKILSELYPPISHNLINQIKSRYKQNKI